MKRVFIPLFCLLIGMAAQVHAQNKPTESGAKKDGAFFKFKDGDTFDFGEVPLGPDVTHDFIFTNIGNQPLIIMDANPSCSCTTPEWDKAPIPPGQNGKIKVGYKTKDHAGPFNKDVYIQSNAPGQNGEKRYTIHIKGVVKDK